MDEGVEGCLAARNPLLGTGVFVFLKLSGSWRLRAAPESPECYALGNEAVDGNFRWVTAGFIRAILLNEQKKKAYLLSVEVREFRGETQAIKFVNKYFSEIQAREDIREMGPIQVGGHHARYALWVHHSRSILRRTKKAEALMECAFYCRQTRRLLRLKVLSKTVEGLIRDKEAILSILSSVTCH